MYVCVRACMYMCACVCVCACAHACVYVCAHVLYICCTIVHVYVYSQHCLSDVLTASDPTAAVTTATVEIAEERLLWTYWDWSTEKLTVRIDEGPSHSNVAM